MHSECHSRSPSPNPSQDGQRLLFKLTADNDIDVFLSIFKRVAIQEGWPQRYWLNALAPLLTEETQQAHYALTDENASDYLTLKDEIVALCGLSQTRATTEFQLWVYHPVSETWSQMDAFLQIMQWWFQPDQLTSMELMKCLTIHQ